MPQNTFDDWSSLVRQQAITWVYLTQNRVADITIIKMNF